jgi:methionine synthase II (cobalamin-independent)
MPGTDIDAALATVLTELPDLPHVPELPGRGPGSDLIGRATATLVDLHVDLQPAGWRLVPRPGQDERRARESLERDLDALVPVLATHDGPLKVQLAGPWTLAASVQTDRGPALADRGAVRDLVASFAEGVRSHLDEVRRRVPHAQLMLQLDEPSLPAVLAGGVPTVSGWSRIAPVEEPEAERLLQQVVAAAAIPVVVHCCASDVPVGVLQRAGAAGISVDLAVLRVDHDAVGSAIDAGVDFWAGVVPSLGPGVPPAPREVIEPVRRLWHELGFGPDLLSERVVLTPACGLAGASIGWSHSALRLVRESARILTEAPDRVLR